VHEGVAGDEVHAVGGLVQDEDIGLPVSFILSEQRADCKRRTVRDEYRGRDRTSLLRLSARSAGVTRPEGVTHTIKILIIRGHDYVQ